MRVYIELAGDVDASTWAERNTAGRAADTSPYGLGRLEGHGHVVRFREPLWRPAMQRIADVVGGRVWGLQPVAEARRWVDPVRRTADVVLCMDERTGLPATLSPLRTPVVTGVAWLDDPAELSPAYLALARRGLSRAAGVFVECSAMIEPLVEHFGVPRDRLHFVTLGIDERYFSPSPTRGQAGRVFSVGDDRMRDYPTLTAALRRVHDDRPDLTAEIATTLPVELPAEWATMHRRRMDGAVRECYARASVVALALRPTRQGSGLTVILEAMASGRPVVVTDNPGLSDYVEHGVTGLLVPPESPEAMARAVRELVDDPERAAEMGMQGRRRVEERFTSAHMITHIDRVLRASVPV